MNIKKLNASIPASFEYEFTDERGQVQKETINLKIKRLSFRESVSKEFQEAFGEIEKDNAKLADLLCRVIDSWDITEDEDGNVPFAITPENLLDNTSADFIAALAEAVMGKLAPRSKTTENNSDAI